MLIHLRKTKGLKKALAQIKALDEDVEIKDYTYFIHVSSDKLDCYVSRIFFDAKKLCLFIYPSGCLCGDDLILPGYLIETVY